MNIIFVSAFELLWINHNFCLLFF